jgi:hypothetical protein
MDKEKAFQEKKEAELKLLSARIEELKAIMQKTKAEAKIEYTQGLDALEKNWKEVKTKLEDLGKSGKEAGKELKEGIEISLFDLKNAVESAFARLKK